MYIKKIYTKTESNKLYIHIPIYIHMTAIHLGPYIYVVSFLLTYYSVHVSTKLLVGIRVRSSADHFTGLCKLIFFESVWSFPITIAIKKKEKKHRRIL